MDTDDLIRQARRIIDISHTGAGEGVFTEALEFLRVYAGEKSMFFKNLSTVPLKSDDQYKRGNAAAALKAFIRFTESGLLTGISIERKAQIDVVSDFLQQAANLLDDHRVHPAAPTVIIGAALEEFLRNWVEEADLDLGEKKPSLDSYATALRGAELITKQDIKDTTSWSGLRNHAAHGEWDKVNDRSRISLMLDGVNLFMRKYGEHGT